MFGYFLNAQLNICVWKIQVVPRKTFESAVVLKGPFGGSCSKSTAAAVWAVMTAEGGWDDC